MTHIESQIAGVPHVTHAPAGVARATNPTEFLDRLPFGKAHLSIFAASAVGFIFDAFELGILAFAAPSIAKDWNVAPGGLAILFSVTAVGMLIGSYVFGTIADYLGRRSSFRLTILIFAFGSGLSYFAADPFQLGICRLITGIGIGGFIPVDYAIMSEFMPARRRGLLMGLWALSLPVGALLTAQIAGAVIPNFGWQALFLLGVVPALGALFVRMLIPESPRFLLQKGRLDEARQSLLWMNGGRALPLEVETSLAKLEPTKPHAKFSVAELFSPEYRARTSFAWVVWFCHVFGFLGLTPWLPTLLTKFKGLPPSEIFAFMTVFAAVGIAGRVVVALTVDRIGRRPMLIILAAGTVGCLWMLGQQDTKSGLQLWAWSASFFLEGMTGVFAALTPELFPTRFRATGIGWAQGVGRIGGIIAPLAVGAIVVASGVEAVFIMLAAAYVVVFVAAWMFRTETKGLSLEVASKDVRP